MFSRLLKGMIGGPCIQKCWGKVYCLKQLPSYLLSVVIKVFEKLVSNRVVDHIEKCALFSDFWYIWF